MGQTLLNNDGQAVTLTVDDGGPGSAFAPKIAAEPSPAPSATAGAPAEPANPSAEPVNPAPTPSATAQPPAPAPAEPAPAPTPAETKEDGTPAAAPAEPAAPVQPDPAALQELVKFRDDAADEAHRTAQSVYDRRTATQDVQITELSDSVATMRAQLREREIAELETPEEQAEMRQKYALADGSEVLDKREADLVVYHKFLLVESYKMEFSEFGVTEEALQGFDTPEAMEAYCFEQKANTYEQRLNGAPTSLATAIAAAPEVSATAPAPEPTVPAAAKTTPDPVGGGGGGDQPTPNIGKGQAAMREGLAALKVDTVR